MKRIRLLSTVTRLQRTRHAVQLGLAPDRSLIVESAVPGLHRRLLGLLDGTRSEAVVRHEATRLGIPADDVNRLLAALRQRGLLVEPGGTRGDRLTPSGRRRLDQEAAALALRTPPGAAGPATMRRRQRQRVLLTGRSRLAAPLAALLAASGIGTVHPNITGTVLGTDPTVGGVLPADTRQSYRRATREAIHRISPDTDTRTVPESDADLVVHLGRPTTGAGNGPRRPAGAAHRPVRHLTAWIRDGTVVIGPLVRPGRTTCHRCVEEHRRDRDPHWSVLSAQLATMPHPTEHVETPILTLAAAVTATQVLDELDGNHPATLNGTLEITAPLSIRRRSWSPHPRCPHHH